MLIIWTFVQHFQEMAAHNKNYKEDENNKIFKILLLFFQREWFISSYLAF